MTQKQPRRLWFGLGFLTGLAGGWWLFCRRNAARHMLFLNIWQRELAKTRGEVDAALLAGRIQAHYNDLWAHRPHFTHPVLNWHVRASILPGLALYQVLREEHETQTAALAEAETLIAYVGDRVRFMVHENWRFRPPYRQAAGWLADGRVGQLHEFQLTVRSSGLVAPTRSGKPFALVRQPFLAGLKRFIIMELLIHHLDTIRYLVGPVHVRDAAVARVSPDVIGEDLALISLQADNGALGMVSGNFSAGGFPPLPADRLELIGEKASILFENNILQLRGETEETVEFDFAQTYQRSYDNAIAHFVQALQNGTPFETGAADNLQTLRLVDDAYRRSGS